MAIDRPIDHRTAQCRPNLDLLAPEQPARERSAGYGSIPDLATADLPAGHRSIPDLATADLPAGYRSIPDPATRGLPPVPPAAISAESHGGRRTPLLDHHVGDQPFVGSVRSVAPVHHRGPLRRLRPGAYPALAALLLVLAIGAAVAIITSRSEDSAIAARLGDDSARVIAGSPNRPAVSDPAGGREPLRIDGFGGDRAAGDPTSDSAAARSTLDEAESGGADPAAPAADPPSSATASSTAGSGTDGVGGSSSALERKSTTATALRRSVTSERSGSGGATVPTGRASRPTGSATAAAATSRPTTAAGSATTGRRTTSRKTTTTRQTTTASRRTTTARPTTTTTPTVRSTGTSPTTRSTTSSTTPTTAGGGSGRVIWEEQFNSLNTSTWKLEHSSYGDGNNELQCYRPENVSVANGKLILKAVTETYTCPGGSVRQVTSGMVRSRGVEFSPGQAIEFRVKLTPADSDDQSGLWPGVWASSWAGTWPRGGEMDWLEVMTAEDPKRAMFSMHYADPSGAHALQNRGVIGSEYFSAAWHVVRFDYGRNGRLTWYLDGVQAFSVNSAATLQGYPAPFDETIGEIKINLALGGRPGPLSPGAVGSSGASFEMDYIRIIEL